MTAEKGLLDREIVKRRRPLAKAVMALILWSNSAITMALCCAWVEQQLTGRDTPTGYAVGVVITVILSMVQIFTKDANTGWYLVALIPGVATTAVQHARWLVPVLVILLGTVAGWSIALSLAILIGWYSERLPERMLFGATQKMYKAHNHVTS